MTGTTLIGRRVFIVEDEMMVAMLIEDMLGEMGCAVVGPAGRIEDALSIAGEAAMDAAVLDLNLNGHETYPVADVLRRRASPSSLRPATEPTDWRNGSAIRPCSKSRSRNGNWRGCWGTFSGRNGLDAAAALDRRRRRDVSGYRSRHLWG